MNQSEIISAVAAALAPTSAPPKPPGTKQGAPTHTPPVSTSELLGNSKPQPPQPPNVPRPAEYEAPAMQNNHAQSSGGPVVWQAPNVASDAVSSSHSRQGEPQAVLGVCTICNTHVWNTQPHSQGANSLVYHNQCMQARLQGPDVPQPSFRAPMYPLSAPSVAPNGMLPAGPPLWYNL